MLAMGFSLTLAQILAPLHNWQLVLRVLLANFVLVPGLAFTLTLLIPLSDPLKTGLILLGAAGGAPFLPKLAQYAHGQVALSVGLMVLLMVLTIFYLPIAVPLIVPGAKVHPLSIAVSLVLTMLVPLGLALVVRARYPEPAGQLRHIMAQASNVAILLVLVTSLLANFQEIIGVIGTGGIVAALILIGGGVVIGYLLGGPGGETRTVVGLGTGQRNISAALLVSIQSFTNPNVLAMVLVASTVGLFFLLPLSFEIGRRTARTPKDRGGSQVRTHQHHEQPDTATSQPTGAAPTA
jgi:BASS family bile acid:Na+ symporter